jgi:hypothetical protein
MIMEHRSDKLVMDGEEEMMHEWVWSKLQNVKSGTAVKSHLAECGRKCNKGRKSNRFHVKKVRNLFCRE